VPLPPQNPFTPAVGRVLADLTVDIPATPQFALDR